MARVNVIFLDYAVRPLYIEDFFQNGKGWTEETNESISAGFGDALYAIMKRYQLSDADRIAKLYAKNEDSS